MDFRIIGSSLLIIGTSIGAGILALPIVTAAGGFYPACLLLLVCWLVMTLGAFYLLEVNLSMPPESNLISMAKHTLGIPGQIIAWITYLLLLYSLISAYLAGGTEVLSSLLSTLPKWVNTLIFLFVLGFIVYKGVRSVDWVNRGLMLLKLAALFLLIFLALPHIKSHYLQIGSIPSLLPAVMVVITSFGFAVIIPSLRIYLNGDKQKLRLALFSGSFIALICYFLWILVIQGTISAQGAHGLVDINQSATPVDNLIATLIQHLKTPFITSLIHIFTAICMLTSFMGVSLSLSDFLSDGFQLRKQGKNNFIIYGLTFLPPLLLVLFLPTIFIKALQYAGIFCVILLILLPALMAWKSRSKASSDYQVWGGKGLLVTVIIISIVLLMIAVKIHS